MRQRQLIQHLVFQAIRADVPLDAAHGMFCTMGKSGDEKMTLAGLADGLLCIGVPVSEAELEELLRAADTSGDRQIDIGEFRNLVSNFNHFLQVSMTCDSLLAGCCRMCMLGDCRSYTLQMITTTQTVLII